MGVAVAYLRGSVNQELLLRNEYLAAENRILRAKFSKRVGFLTRNESVWPKSESGWGEKHFGTSLALPNPIRS